ncbi:MAG: hypothetical protein HYU41_06730 [Candidatus Rokubacteria bacterium]|nr:hypothetical protein [Candidatus Rokubacteria bacterium]
MTRIAVAIAAVLLAGCTVALPRYRYDEQQLGRRTWEIRAGDSWPGAAPDLERFVLYRAAERTREMGLGHFVIRDSTLDMSRARSLSYPPVTEGNELGTAVDRLDYLYRTPYSELTKRWQRVKFRMVRESEVADHVDVVDAAKVLDRLRPFIDRRR